MKKFKTLIPAFIIMMFLFIKADAQTASGMLEGQWSVNMGLDRMTTEDARKLNAAVMVLLNDGSAYLQVNDINYDVYKYRINTSTSPWQIDFYTNRPADAANPQGGGMIFGIIDMAPNQSACKIEWDPNLGTNRPTTFSNNAFRLEKNQ